MKSMDDFQNKTPNTWVDLLIGFGISAAAYALIWFASVGNFIPVSILVLVDLVIVAILGFLIVKFFRTGHKPAAIIMLVLVSPGILSLLLFGACSLLFLQG